MTKKFNVVDLGEVLAISVYDECEYYQNSDRDYYKLCERLNNLYEIKEHHKKENLNLLHENKELKTFKDKLFALIDARIEIYKRKPFMAPVSAPMSVNFDEDTDRLARLSELEQLKKELS